MMQIGMPGRARQAMVLLTAAAFSVVLLVLLFWTKPAGAAFPGTNGKIVLSGDAPHSATSEDYDSDLFSMDPSGANQTNLTNTAVDIEGQPAVSPDGTKVAFLRDYGAFGGNQDIWVMNADGTNQTRRTTTSPNEFFPAWSPDGTKIAYSRTVTRNLELFKMNPDGTNVIRLTRTSSKDDYWPDWSPDGTKIAFVREAAGGKLYEASAEIYTVDAGGKNAVGLTKNTTEDFEPAWSSDGTKIAFAATRSGDFETYVMTANGSNVTNLTNKPTTDEYDPSWGVAP